MKALVGAFNQEKALLEAFSVIVKTGCGTNGALYTISEHKHSVYSGSSSAVNTQLDNNGPGAGAVVTVYPVAARVSCVSTQLIHLQLSAFRPH